MRISKSFSGTSGAIAAARQLMSSFLYNVRAGGTAVEEEAVEGAALVVSELVTNAVKHTDGPLGVDLCITGEAVEICVWDSSPARPVLMGPDPARIGRHGMEIVAVLCGGFSVTPRAGGKQITARLPLRAGAA
ncbi:Histidine kinase-like ATPase domain-containing protein [Actinacidiphila alni]|uniref:Histidine kinase-like ATPase domain-containing protein n=1 Tax=Actinacidiphila alni TaxID=380248 RepID=A0A1I2MP79_9ACTN|nr:ATP-binding protein [Actinacidiphila alni]SFF90941.1 Histidine kinase-like ATPase domain-containing protein [Actinacidiphila alni]